MWRRRRNESAERPPFPAIAAAATAELVADVPGGGEGASEQATADEPHSCQQAPDPFVWSLDAVSGERVVFGPNPDYMPPRSEPLRYPVPIPEHAKRAEFAAAQRGRWWNDDARYVRGGCA